MKQVVAIVLSILLTNFVYLSNAMAWGGRDPAPPRPDTSRLKNAGPLEEAPSPEFAKAVQAQYTAYMDRGDQISDWLASRPDSGTACSGEYDRLFSKQQIDARLAIGYYDYADTTKSAVDPEAVWTTVPYFDAYDPRLGTSPRHDVHLGPNISLDPWIYKQVLEVLLRPCPAGSRLEVCGFRPSGAPGEFTKRVANTDVRLRVTQASASPFYEWNAPGGRLSGLQAQKTRESEENFFGGLRVADLVSYVGHARNSGGPDFSPPMLNEHRHPDYLGYYKVVTPGLRKMREAMSSRAPGDHPYLVAIMACLSDLWFGSTARRLAPSSRVVLTGDVSWPPALVTGALGSLDAVLRKQCAPQFKGEIILPAGIADNPGPGYNASRSGEEVQLWEPANAGFGRSL